MSDHKLTIPANATFVKTNGEEAEVTPDIKRLGDAILELDVYPNQKAGQQVINAFWDAYSMVEVLRKCGGKITWNDE